MMGSQRPSPALPEADEETTPVLDVFVAARPSERGEMARLLVETADDNGLSQRHIVSANRGFYISDALADFVYAEPDETPDPADAGDGTTK